MENAMTDYLTASMDDKQSDSLSMHVSTDRDQVTMTIGNYNDDEDVPHKLRIAVVTKESVNICMSIEDARRLANVLFRQAAYAELHGCEEDQHPDAIAARNYMANAKRMRESGR